MLTRLQLPQEIPKYLPEFGAPAVKWNIAKKIKTLNASDKKRCGVFIETDRDYNDYKEKTNYRKIVIFFALIR